MLDRIAVEQFLDLEFEDIKPGIPEDIPKDTLVEAFCQYVENDYYEWLKDNFRSFFSAGADGIDWDWIRERIQTVDQR